MPGRFFPTRRRTCCAILACCLSLVPARGEAQVLSNRGFVEARITLFLRDAPTDPVNTVADLLVRDELFVKPTTWLRFAAGLDLRANTHDQVEESWRLDIADRRRRRPAASIRRLAGTLTHGPLTVDLGKQFIRWGKTDIVTPTDRFAPRDFLNVIDTEFLAVSGARGVIQHGPHTIDLVWVPVFTPSRIPLLDQRWAPALPDPSIAGLRDLGALIPHGSQAGVRYSRIADRFEYSISIFNGFNHLPNFELAALPDAEAPDHSALSTSPDSLSRAVIGVRRVYPTMRSYGGDLAMPTRWFTIKGEAAYSTSGTPAADDYVLYVIQLERQTGEWQLVGGYAGEAVTRRRAVSTFAPDRGLTRAIIARAAYTIDSNRSVAFEGAARQNGRGVYSKIEYSQARGPHWRVTVSGVAIGGHRDDFLGQYSRNTHIAAALRYSF
jgi:hypothetical protein